MYPMLFDKDKIKIEIFREFCEIEEDKFISLFKAIFKREFPAEAFRWYELLKGENVWAIAQEKDTGEFVAIYGLMPISIFLKGENISGYLCHNVGVGPSYWATGMFQYIGEKTLKEVLKSRELAIGFSNKLALKGHKRIGWQEIGKMKFYLKERFRKYNESEFRNIYEVDRFEGDIDDLILNSGNREEFLIRKEHNFLNWRISKPFQSYKCFVYRENGLTRGYMIFKFYEDQQSKLKKGHIIDIQAEQDDIFLILLRKAEELATSEETDLLNVWVFEQSDIINLLLEEGFNYDESSYDYSFITYSNDVSITTISGNLDARKVKLSLGDNDVF